VFGQVGPTVVFAVGSTIQKEVFRKIVKLFYCIPGCSVINFYLPSGVGNRTEFTN